MDWYQNQVKKKKNQQKTNEIVLLNQQLHRLLHDFQKEDTFDTYLKSSARNKIRKYNTSIFRPWHRGMLEDSMLSMEVLIVILDNIPYVDKEKQKQYWHQIDRCLHQLINIDYQYNFLLGDVYQNAKRNTKM